MGMYTALHYNVELVENVPDQVVMILKYMCGQENLPLDLPKHDLFDTDRWHVMFRMDSYYFPETTHSTIEWDEIGKCWFLNIRCNLKNYCNEIDLFCDWIDPYVHAESGAFLGFSRYEESEEPEIIRKR